MSQFNKQFTAIFGTGNDDSSTRLEDETGDSEEDNNVTEESGYSWIIMIDSVSEVTHIPWDKIWTMDAAEFLSYACYVKYKNEKIRELQNKKNNIKSY